MLDLRQASPSGVNTEFKSDPSMDAKWQSVEADARVKA